MSRADQITRMYQGGSSISDIANEMGVSKAYVSMVVRQFRVDHAAEVLVRKLVSFIQSGRIGQDDFTKEEVEQLDLLSKYLSKKGLLR